MKFLAGLLAFIATASSAASPQPKPTIPTAVAFTQGTVTRTLDIPANGTCVRYVETPVSGQHGARRFQLLCGNTAAGSYVQFSADAGPIYAQWLWPAPACGQEPAPASQHADCAAPLVGPGWTQTHGWTCVAGVWQAGTWQPTDPPAGACSSPPPPGGDIDLSYVDKASPAYARFKSWVDACLPGSSCYGFTPTDIAFMAKLDGGAQYCPKAVAMADAYVTRVESAIAAGGQPNWTGDPNGNDGLSSDSYLSVGVRLRDIALPLKWCASTVTSSQAQRFTAVIAQATFNVWNPSQAKWGGHAFPWSGWAVTPPDPGDNYYYSFTLATMMDRWVTGDTSYDSHTWPVLDAYFATIPTGGSEEGTGYGTSHKMLFEIVRWEAELFGENHVDAHLINSIYYWIAATTPDFLRFGAIGDQSRVSNPTLWDYQWVLVAQARTMTPDPAAKAQAAWWLHAVDPSGLMTNSINNRDGLLLDNSAGTAPTALSYFGQSTGDLFMRTDWTPNALWVGFRAGKYDQSHAHQDQGSFEMYLNGAWLVVDASIGSHSGIQQGVTNNATLAFSHNGSIARQVYNSTSTMTVTGTDPATGIHATANLQPAVGVAASAWTRTLDFVGRTVTVSDTFTPSVGYTATWQLPVPVQPTVNGNVIVAGHLKATVVEPSNATITVVDMRTVDSDFGSGYRVDVKGGTGAYQVRLETQ